MPSIRDMADRAWQAAGSVRYVEWIPLAAMLIVALAVWGFLELADEVAEGSLESFDRSVLLSLRHPENVDDPLGPPWLEELMRDFTALGSLGVLTATTVIACGYLWLLGKHSAVAYVLVAILGAAALSSVLKELYDRPRPAVAPHAAPVFTASFPSGHSVMAAATYLTLGALLARYQAGLRLRVYLVAVAILLALAVGISRVYLSVHWPTDVIAGWTIGSAWALLCWAVAAWLQRRGMIERRPAA